MTVGSALRMRPGLGWMLAFSAVFCLGANSLSSVLNQMCKGSGTGREGEGEGGGWAGGGRERESAREMGRRGWRYSVLCEYGEPSY